MATKDCESNLAYHPNNIKQPEIHGLVGICLIGILLPWRNQHLFPGPTKFMVAVHGWQMMYQVPSSYDLAHKRIQRCDMSDHIHHRVIDLVVFINQTFDIFEAMHWSMEPWKSAKPMAEPKKNIAMLEKAEKVRLLAAWDEQHTAELDMDQLLSSTETGRMAGTPKGLRPPVVSHFCRKGVWVQKYHRVLQRSHSRFVDPKYIVHPGDCIDVDCDRIGGFYMVLLTVPLVLKKSWTGNLVQRKEHKMPSPVCFPDPPHPPNPRPWFFIAPRRQSKFVLDWQRSLSKYFASVVHPPLRVREISGGYPLVN